MSSQPSISPVRSPINLLHTRDKPIPPHLLAMVKTLDMLTDILEMTAEGYAEADIAQYLKRTYGVGE